MKTTAVISNVEMNTLRWNEGSRFHKNDEEGMAVLRYYPTLLHWYISLIINSI